MPTARLQLGQALQRAKYAIAWEQTWPHLARLLSLIGLFLVVSWAGLWLTLPFVARAVGLGLFVLAALWALWPLVKFRWPSREAALSRLDRGTGIRHRPATALTDTLATQDPVALALWQAQRERTLASLKRIRAGLPSPRLPIHDPRALRALVAVMLVATFFAAGDERRMRISAAFDWNGVLAPANIRVDAWVTPPLYTGKPPIILSAANKDAAAPAAGPSGPAGPLPVPAGSTLIVRSSGGTLDVVTSGAVTEAVAVEQAPKGTNEKQFTIAGDGTAQVRSPSGQPQWKFSATGDRAPTIALAKDPERQARGSLQMSYKIEDDYGVTEAQARFAARSDDPAKDPAKGDAAPRPLFDAPQFPLALPNARTRNGVGQTVKDLTEDPYAGADVTLTLTAKDEAGNEGKSEPFDMRLPERLFTKPLARALIEQRRILALDANQIGQVYAALDALMIAPHLFTPEAGQYLGLYSVARQLEAARTDPALREVVAACGRSPSPSRTAISPMSTRRCAPRRRRSSRRWNVAPATRRSRSSPKICARRWTISCASSPSSCSKNPQQLARPLDPNTRMLSQQDLKNMLDRMERLSRSGDKDAARQLLEQLQQMLENLQMAQPGQCGDGDMEQALNELGDMIRKQQQLRDKTYKQGQDSRRDRKRGKQGDQSMGDLQQDQQGLRDRLKRLQEELAKRGMGQGQRGEKGQQGRQGQQGQPGQGQQGETASRATARTALARPTVRDGRRPRPARRGQCRWRGGFARPGAGSAAQGRPEPCGGDAAGRWRRPERRPRQSRRPPAGRAARRSAWASVARPRVRRRLHGEDSRRDRRAARAPHSGRTAPPSCRSGASADRARLHRAAAEGLLSLALRKRTSAAPRQAARRDASASFTASPPARPPPRCGYRPPKTALSPRHERWH